MGDAVLPAAGALWLGIVTSISPCPLAANIAAVSYIGKDVEDSRRVLWSGLLYALGRSIAYVGLGVLLVESFVRAPALSLFLSKYLNVVLGPLLVLVGMVLLGLLQWAGGGGLGAAAAERARRFGLLGALLLGVLFALSFCPVSAGFFFGGLVPLAVKHDASILLSTLYGLGTAIPVIIFAVLLAVGARSLGTALRKAAAVGSWARSVTGFVFILVGVYLSLVHIYEVV